MQVCRCAVSGAKPQGGVGEKIATTLAEKLRRLDRWPRRQVKTGAMRWCDTGKTKWGVTGLLLAISVGLSGAEKTAADDEARECLTECFRSAMDMPDGVPDITTS